MKTYRATQKGQAPDLSLQKPGAVFSADFGEVEPSWAVEVEAVGEAPVDEAPKPSGRKPAGRTSVDETDG
jgi:hypothetical protein